MTLKCSRSLSANNKRSVQFCLSVDLYVKISLFSRLQELRTESKGKVQKWSLSLTGAVVYESFQFKRGFTKVVVTRAGRFREWSQAVDCTKYIKHCSDNWSGA